MKQIAIAICLLSTAAFSQEEEHTEESFIPRFSVATGYYSWNDDADFSDVDGSVGQYEYGADAAFPIVMNDQFKLTAGFKFRETRFDFSGDTPLGTRSLDLTRVELPFNLWTEHSEKWKSWVRFQPGVSSDFEDVTEDDITVTALALLAYKYSETLTLAGGAYFSQDLGDSTVLPAIGAIWKPSNQWVVGLTLPRIEIIYAPTRDWLLTARAYPSGGTWNIADLNDPGAEDVDYNYSAIRAGVGIDRRLKGRLWGFVDVGYQFAQEIEIEGGDDAFSEDLDNNVFINVGAKLRF